MQNKGVILKRPTYSIEVKYSEEAIKNKLMKFTPVDGKSFEISSEDMISFLVNQVNLDTLSPTFVETDKINVVEVGRQIQCVLDKDMKKGEKININYVHPYPVEFALVEEAHKIAKIKQDVPVFTITKEYLDKVREKITPEMENYMKKFYSSFKGFNLDKKI